MNNIHVEQLFSEWSVNVNQVFFKKNLLCIGVFERKELIYSNDAFLSLAKGNAADSLINPTIDILLAIESEEELIFDGFLTLGDYNSVNTSIVAQVYKKNSQLLVVGGVEISLLLEQNLKMHSLNREISTLQRDLIKRKIELEKALIQLSETNAQLNQLNQEYLAINENLNASNEEIQTLVETLSVRNERLNELNATKDKFFSIIAHDLKSPFSVLLGFNKLLSKNADKYPPEQIKKIAQSMHNTSKQTFSLLENLLEWARIQTGTLMPKFQSVHPSELISEIDSVCAPMARAKNILYVSECLSYESIRIDVEMIKTVLRNLISNAVKFTYPQGMVKVSCTTEGVNVLFSVIDTGTGIDPQFLDKIFRIDGKLSKKGTDNEVGTGLGLILCKEFIEKNGGRIWVESKVGVGSEFKFSLPMEELGIED